MNVEDAASYGTAAADIYAAFHALPNASTAADDWNIMQALGKALGTRAGARVVDLGCGAGWRTREIAVVPGVTFAFGIDHSPEQLARAVESGTANCRFALGDLIALGRGSRDWAQGDAEVEGLLGTFDVALMAFVTSHAATQDDLDAMLRAAAAFLVPGGDVVVVDTHPGITRAPFPASDRYGLVKEFCVPAGHIGDVPPFTKIRTTFVTPKGELTVEDYFHDVRSWQAAVEAAGLSSLAIEDFSAPPGYEPGFWDPYITPEHPSVCAQGAVIRAFKSALA